MENGNSKGGRTCETCKYNQPEPDNKYEADINCQQCRYAEESTGAKQQGWEQGPVVVDEQSK